MSSSSCYIDECIDLQFSLSRTEDPLIHHRQHFGRMVYAMCSIQALITSAIARMGEDEDISEESLTSEFV